MDINRPHMDRNRPVLDLKSLHMDLKMLLMSLIRSHMKMFKCLNVKLISNLHLGVII